VIDTLVIFFILVIYHGALRTSSDLQEVAGTDYFYGELRQGVFPVSQIFFGGGLKELRP
jgi:hypothetical protein